MINQQNDTICAVSTPAGVGGIAVIRVSGPRAVEAAGSLWEGKSLEDTEPNRARFGRIIDRRGGGELLDEAVATVFRAPRSFTGEDVVELSVHGSKYVQRRLLELLVGAGCRLAEPGEFTRRAFASGKMDLAQAEAVADVIASNSRAAHRLASSQMKGTFSRRLGQLRDKLLELASLLELELDFSEEEVEFASRERLSEIAREVHREVTRLGGSFSAGNAIKEGIPVAIVGPTNAGKSSLLNLLLGEDRAIVSDIHGTTRDTIEDTLEIGDYLFRFIDTAGLRETSDPIEALGIERSRDALRRAAVTILVLDSTRPLDTQLTPDLLDGPRVAEQCDPQLNQGAFDGQRVAEHSDKQLTPGPLDGKRVVVHSDARLTAEHLDSQRFSESSASQSSSELSDSRHILDDTARESGSMIILLNKSDLHNPASATSDTLSDLADATVIPFSTKTGQGHETLLATLTNYADNLRGTGDEDTLLVTNLRHAEALRSAAETTAAILDGLATGLPGDLIAQDLRATIHHLSTITGSLTTPDILASIFSRFCIGK